VIFFDTNILIYYSVNQSEEKQRISKQIIENAIINKEFYISPLVYNEYIFSLAKLKMIDKSSSRIEYFKSYIQEIPFKALVVEASTLCQNIDFCKNINDIVHLKVAEEYCTKLVTFDSDFKKLKDYTQLEIEILS
jgi:predicted nucleic acid-binding protein